MSGRRDYHEGERRALFYVLPKRFEAFHLGLSSSKSNKSESNRVFRFSVAVSAPLARLPHPVSKKKLLLKVQLGNSDDERENKPAFK